MGLFDVPPDSTHAAHVLFPGHGMDNATSPKKQQRLEAGMGHEMEDCRRIGGHPDRKEHISELAAGGIGDHALDVRLGQRASRGKKGRCCADKCDEGQGIRREFEQRRQAGAHKDACRYHRRGVDKRRNRCWTLHSIGQPRVQSDLRRFAHRADEQQEAQQFDGRQFHAEETDAFSDIVRSGYEYRRKMDRFEHQPNAKNSQCKAEVSDTVHDKGLDGSGVGRRPVVPKSDQKIGTEANTLPPEEELDQIVRGDQHQHGEGKEAQIGHEARFVRIMAHIADRIPVDAGRHAVDDHQHDRGKRVEPKRPVRLKPAGPDPVENMHRFRDATAISNVYEDRNGTGSGNGHRKARHQLRRAVSHKAPEQTDDDRRQKREKYCSQIQHA